MAGRLVTKLKDGIIQGESIVIIKDNFPRRVGIFAFFDGCFGPVYWVFVLEEIFG